MVVEVSFFSHLFFLCWFIEWWTRIVYWIFCQILLQRSNMRNRKAATDCFPNRFLMNARPHDTPHVASLVNITHQVFIVLLPITSLCAFEGIAASASRGSPCPHFVVLWTAWQLLNSSELSNEISMRIMSCVSGCQPKSQMKQQKTFSWLHNTSNNNSVPLVESFESWLFLCGNYQKDSHQPPNVVRLPRPSNDESLARSSNCCTHDIFVRCTYTVDSNVTTKICLYDGKRGRSMTSSVAPKPPFWLTLPPQQIRYYPSRRLCHVVKTVTNEIIVRRDKREDTNGIVTDCASLLHVETIRNIQPIS